MQLSGIRGVSRAKRIVTTVPAPVQRDPPDLAKRRWNRGEPDRVWVADPTYAPSNKDMEYTSFVQDGRSKRIPGFTVASSMATSIVNGAPEQAT